MYATAHAKVWLVLGATDMRRSINGLSLLVANHLEMDVFSGQLYVFCNRGRTMVKILYWDRNGFCVWQKRLEKSRFFWPRSEREVLQMEHRQLSWLLDGLDPVTTKGHPELHFSRIL